MVQGRNLPSDLTQSVLLVIELAASTRWRGAVGGHVGGGGSSVPRSPGSFVSHCDVFQRSEVSFFAPQPSLRS